MSSCISMTENIASGILLLQELLFFISVLEFVFGAYLPLMGHKCNKQGETCV